MIPYGRHDVSQADIDAVVDVLRSEFLTQGPAVPRLERAVAGRVGAKSAIAVNSATSALHIACMAIGVDRGDLVWTVPNTFVASANCARYCGADVDFVDIEADTWNMSVDALEEKLQRARRANRIPKAVIPVHFAGQAPDQQRIWELSKAYGFRVIEDASHAVGASRAGEAVGSCRWSDVAVFSFHPVKIVTTAEGGMAMTNDERLATRMAMLRSHGITRDAERFVYPEKATAWYYEQQSLGFNYRLTDLQAALGLAQLDRIDGFIDRRNALARRYDAELGSLPLQLPVVRPENRSAFHLYVIRLQVGANRRRVFEALRARHIGVNVHYMPVYLQPYYRSLGFAPGLCPEAEAYAEAAITIPLYPALTDAEQDGVVSAIRASL